LIIDENERAWYELGPPLPAPTIPIFTKSSKLPLRREINYGQHGTGKSLFRQENHLQTAGWIHTQVSSFAACFFSIRIKSGDFE
jgi:hypothetical protein